MNRKEFERRNAMRWQEYVDMVEALEQKRPPQRPERLPGMFRQVCADLALAENRAYGLKICERLNDLVIRGYRFVYRGTGSGLHSMLRFFMVTFPRSIRSNARLFWLGMALFWLPYGAFVFAARFAPEWIELFLGEEAMASMDSMYGKDADISDHRDSFASNFSMFAFYIFNNMKIGFQAFAGGLLFCVGAIFVLLFNGMHIGASAGLVHMSLDKEKFYSFVATHSSWELIGIIICGVAGMRLGLAPLHPGRRTRRAALAAAGRRAIPLLYGGSAMIFIAAIFEGFVSVSDTSPQFKYTLGISFWVMFTLYFLFCGRAGEKSELETA